MDGDGALNWSEFCIAMQLVFARRRGAVLPDVLPVSLADLCVPQRAKSGPSELGLVVSGSPSQLPLLDRTTPPPSNSDSDSDTDSKVGMRNA